MHIHLLFRIFAVYVFAFLKINLNDLVLILNILFSASPRAGAFLLRSVRGLRVRAVHLHARASRPRAHRLQVGYRAPQGHHRVESGAVPRQMPGAAHSPGRPEAVRNAHTGRAERDPRECARFRGCHQATRERAHRRVDRPVLRR